MVCFFCIATVALVSGAVGVSVIEGIRAGLEQLARNGVKVTDDTPSTQRLELEVSVPTLPEETAPQKGRARPAMVPVAVTVYKKHARVRVQVLTHDVTPREAEAVQDAVVAAAGLDLVHRSSEHEQHTVHEAMARLTQGDTASGAQATATTWQQER